MMRAMTKRQAMRGHERGETEEERASHVSVAGENNEEPELGEMRIYFDQARGESRGERPTSLPV